MRLALIACFVASGLLSGYLTAGILIYALDVPEHPSLEVCMFVGALLFGYGAGRL